MILAINFTENGGMLQCRAEECAGDTKQKMNTKINYQFNVYHQN